MADIVLPVNKLLSTAKPSPQTLVPCPACSSTCKLCRNGMTTPAQALRYICRWYLETTGQRPSAENSLTTTPKEDE
jgi:hypothetical protein